MASFLLACFLSLLYVPGNIGLYEVLPDPELAHPVETRFDLARY